MNLPSRQIDYPELASSQPIRPPPAAASPALERQASRPWLNQQRPSFSLIPAIGPPRISSQYPVVFWGDDKVGVSGLKNLGNTCYANAPLQCLSATIPFAQFFKGEWDARVKLFMLIATRDRHPMEERYQHAQHDGQQGCALCGVCGARAPDVVK